MEAELEKVVQNALSNPSWQGVVVSDLNGLPLASRGSLTGTTGVMAAEILNIAKQLEPGTTEVPVVCINGDNSKLYFSQSGKVIVASHVSS